MDGATYTTSKGKVHINFAKPCSCGRRQQSISVGKLHGLERAEAVRAALERIHGQCHDKPTETAPAETAEAIVQRRQQEIERVAKELSVQKAKAAEFEHQAGLFKRKAALFDEGKAKESTGKRVRTWHDNMRLPIDPANRTAFGDGVLSSKMCGDRGTWICGILEEHCQGSEAKLLEIVYSIVKRYNLREQVTRYLGYSIDLTNAFIVDRMASIMSELKHCRSEQQRQQYRMLWTAVVPPPGSSMEAQVARALRAKSARQGKPFKDAIQKRAEIDQAIKNNHKRLQVGDDVMCRHGVGKLVEYDSAYESVGSGDDGPCAVEIEVSGHKHVARFRTSGKGKGGARLMRIPISLAHGPRRSEQPLLLLTTHCDCMY